MLKMIGICISLLNSYWLLAQPIVTQNTIYKESNPWLYANNAAGLLFNPRVSFSIAEGGYHYTQGKFHTSTTASSIHHYYFNSESYRQLKKLQLYGLIAYTGNSQHHQQWNVTLQPENHLFQFGDTIAGRQQCETYSLCGKIAIPLNSSWIIGGTIDYSARSNSKNIDPRNKNNQTDLLLSPGVIFSLSQFHFGTNLVYHRIVEKITYSQINPQTQEARTYYPLWFYQGEYFQSGLNNSRIYREERYGGAIQFSLTPDALSWFNELQYTGSTEILDISPNQNKTAGKTERQEFNYTGLLRFHANLQHTLQPSYRLQKRTAYEYLQGQGDNNTQSVETYGLVKRAAILTYDAALTYHLAKPLDSLYNHWKITTLVRYKHEKTLFFVYPIRIEQPISTLTLGANYEHRMKFRKNTLEMTLKITYTTGHGSLPKSSNETQSSSPEIKLPQKQDLLLHDFYILTAKNLTSEVQLHYIHPLPNKFAISFSIKGIYTQALSSTCHSMNRQNYGLSTGFIF